MTLKPPLILTHTCQCVDIWECMCGSDINIIPFWIFLGGRCLNFESFAIFVELKKRARRVSKRPETSKTGRSLCASLRSRNAHGHLTKTRLCENLQEKCRAPDGAPWSNPGLRSYCENPSVWTRCWGKFSSAILYQDSISTSLAALRMRSLLPLLMASCARGCNHCNPWSLPPPALPMIHSWTFSVNSECCFNFRLCSSTKVSYSWDKSSNVRSQDMHIITGPSM